LIKIQKSGPDPKPACHSRIQFTSPLILNQIHFNPKPILLLFMNKH